MSNNVRPLVFDSGESSDNDSIGTDSTAESVGLEEYPVEKILAERSHPEKGLLYLIKWEGYPLARATWEPQENVTTKQILQTWDELKARVKQGKAEAFDTQTFKRAFSDHVKAKAARHARRKIKRRKRGLPESPNRSGDSETDEDDDDNSDDDDDDDDESANDPPVRSHRRLDSVQSKSTSTTRGGSTTVRRGLARPIFKRPLSDSSASSSDGDEHGRRRSLQSVKKAAREPAVGSRRVAEKDADVRRGDTGRRSRSTLERQSTTVLQKAVAAKVVPVAARKSAPGGPAAHEPAIVTDRDVLVNWAAKKRKKQRTGVSGETPKDSMDPQFRRLSTQHRYQQYGKNEKNPDFNALPIVDLTTGKVAPQRDCDSVRVSQEVSTSWRARGNDGERSGESASVLR
jgi:chromo domain-containing protein 1